MFNNKKGVSGVVTVVILVALVLVAIGVIWGVVSNLLEEESETVDVQSKCLDLVVRPVSASCDASGCDVTIRRTAGGDDLGGVKIVYFNGTDYSSVITETDNIGELASQRYTHTSADIGINNPNKVEVTPYIRDSTGNERICQNKNSYNF